MKALELILLMASAIFLMQSTQSNAQSRVSTDTLEKNLKSVFGDQPIQIIAHDDQLKSVTVAKDYFFSTHDGRYLFAGKVIDTERQVDLIAEREAIARRALLETNAKDLFVSYPSQSSEANNTVTVFTDIDCPYCRKLHTYMDEINRLGISVNYVLIPRGGAGSAAYMKALSALCSEQPDQAITQAMQKKPVATASCDSAQLDKQIGLARQLNISSTPTLILPNGELKLGLVRPEQLAELLKNIKTKGV